MRYRSLITTLLRRGPGWPLLLLALLAAAPLAAQAQTGGVGIGTTTPSQKLDGANNVRVGTVGEVLTTNTGTSNMLAVAYGQTGTGGTNVFGGSGNFSVAVVSTGVYTITFPASSGLSGVFGDNLSVNVSFFGSTPGFITTGTITVSAFAMNGAPSSSYYFSFSAFTPSEAS